MLTMTLALGGTGGGSLAGTWCRQWVLVAMVDHLIPNQAGQGVGCAQCQRGETVRRA